MAQRLTKENMFFLCFREKLSQQGPKTIQTWTENSPSFVDLHLTSASSKTAKTIVELPGCLREKRPNTLSDFVVGRV